MGAAPAFNITVEMDEAEAEELASAVADEFGFTSDSDNPCSYKLDVPDEMESGRMTRGNDIIAMNYLERRNEYVGVNGSDTFYIHYSPYYFEDVSTLVMKLNLLEDINTFVEEQVGKDVTVEFTATTCTV